MRKRRASVATPHLAFRHSLNALVCVENLMRANSKVLRLSASHTGNSGLLGVLARASEVSSVMHFE